MITGYFASGQTIEDVCLQRYGSLVYLPDFLKDNDFTYTQTVTVGQSYVYDENFGNKKISNEYIRKNITVNNLNQ